MLCFYTTRLFMLLFLLMTFLWHIKGDDDDPDTGHSRRRGNRGNFHIKAEDGTNEQQPPMKSSKANCMGERHPSFVMPDSLSDADGVDSNDNTNVEEIRMNKYYAVHRDRFYIKNTGLALEIQLQLDRVKSEARIRGADWEDEYVLAKGVFHWQLKNLTVKNPDGTTTFNTNSTDPPLEMELVHYAKRFGSLEAAAKIPRGGVLVTGHLFELVGRDNPALEPIARSALSTTFPNENFKQVHGPLDLKSLFPTQLKYYEFYGIYPLNPCANEARFIVFKNPLFVSARQLKRFGSLRTEDGQKISDRIFMQPRTYATQKKPISSNNKIYLSIVRRLELPGKASRLFQNYYLWIYHCLLIKPTIHLF